MNSQLFHTTDSIHPQRQLGKELTMQTFYGILIPFLGTTLGAACVFFLKKNLNEAISRALTGFAAGVMVAASIWSLLLPAMEHVSWMGKLSFFPQRSASGSESSFFYCSIISFRTSISAVMPPRDPKASCSAPP